MTISIDPFQKALTLLLEPNEGIIVEIDGNFYAVWKDHKLGTDIYQLMYCLHDCIPLYVDKACINTNVLIIQGQRFWIKQSTIQ